MPPKKKLKSKAKPKIKFAMEFLDTPPRSPLRDTKVQRNFITRLEEVVNQRDVRPLVNLLGAGTRLYEQDLLDLDEDVVTPLVRKMEQLRDSDDDIRARTVISRFIQPYFERADEIYREGELPFPSGSHYDDYRLWSNWERQSRRLEPEANRITIQSLIRRYNTLAEPNIYQDILRYTR